MSYVKAMRWQRTHRKGIRQAWCGFHSGIHAPKNPPQWGSSAWAANEAFNAWKRLRRVFAARGEGDTGKRRDVIREEIAAYRLFTGISNFLKEGQS